MARKKTHDLLAADVSPANDEETIRTYFCTYYRSRLIGLEAAGHLSLTNKRVIFHAKGSSSGGDSIIQSEVPIADVSGISSYKGTYFSLGHLLLAFVVSNVVSTVVTGIVNYLGWQLDYGAFQVLGWVVAIASLVGSFALKSEVIWRSVLASTSASTILSLGASSFLGVLRGFGSSPRAEIFLGFLVGLYTLLCYFWYSRRPTFSLNVASKGGSSTPIAISGATGVGILNGSAARALSAEPAEDSELMLKELGALVLDIQMLGDLGIKKWTG